MPAMSGRTLYIDCFSGVAGDMFVGALLDLGVGSLDLLETELKKIDLEGWSLSLEKVRISGVAASRFLVNVEAEQEPRSFSAIEELIAGSRLPAPVRSHCLAIFGRVARAEAEAHGESINTVHFHEIGMVDSIIDIASACVLIEELSPAEIIVSPVALGSGTVETQHGTMRVPVPATEILLKDVPVFPGGEKCEIATPTGAALVSYFADSYGPLPAMILENSGYGAGSRETKGPNLLRLIVGERTGAVAGGRIEQQVVLETNIDDTTPEQLSYLVEKLLEAGAADAWLAPVVMKKGRPGVVLSVLCSSGEVGKFLDLIFTGSSTFGVRARTTERHCLERQVETVETKYGAVRVKIGFWRGSVVTMSPEYEDCRRAADEHGVPLATVYEAARQAGSYIKPQRFCSAGNGCNCSHDGSSNS